MSSVNQLCLCNRKYNKKEIIDNRCSLCKGVLMKIKGNWETESTRESQIYGDVANEAGSEHPVYSNVCPGREICQDKFCVRCEVIGKKRKYRESNINNSGKDSDPENNYDSPENSIKDQSFNSKVLKEAKRTLPLNTLSKEHDTQKTIRCPRSIISKKYGEIDHKQLDNVSQ